VGSRSATMSRVTTSATHGAKGVGGGVPAGEASKAVRGIRFQHGLSQKGIHAVMRATSAMAERCPRKTIHSRHALDEGIGARPLVFMGEPKRLGEEPERK